MRTPRALAAIAAIIEREGGARYTNRPTDRGGPTKFGVTQKALSKWRGYQVSAGEVQDLEQREAEHIFASAYIEKPGLEQIGDQKLFAYAADASVHHGSERAIRMLQRAVGVKDDGILGPVTARAVNDYDPDDLLIRMRRERADFMIDIVVRDPTQLDYAKGWIRRALA